MRLNFCAVHAMTAVIIVNAPRLGKQAAGDG